MPEFEKHRVECARSFIQSVVVIDDEAELGNTEPAPKPLEAPLTGILGEGGEGAETAATIQAAVAVTASDARAISGGDRVAGTRRQRAEAASAGGLDAKALADAFFEREVTCGFYRVAEGDQEPVLRAARSARRADVVVLDWYLRGHSSTLAKEMIAAIVRQDQEDGGRLRLIAVYTSESNAGKLADDTLAALNEPATKELGFTRSAAGAVVLGPGTRICFVQKPGANPTQGDRVVTVGDLPDVLVHEFAHLADGLLPAFAMSAAAAVRRAAHRLVAVLSADLDGAYLAHRCAQDEPDDAQDFAVEIATGELRNALVFDDVAESCLGVNAIAGWVDHRAAHGHVFKAATGAVAPPDLVKEYVRRGTRGIEETHARQVHGEGPPSKENRIAVKRIWEIFHPSTQEADAGNRALARLAALKREPHGKRARFPPDWLPTLSLGTVLEMCPAENAGSTTCEVGRYLVCIQPRCDSVRLEGVTAFPFQPAATDTAFNLVVRNNAGSDCMLRVSRRPRDTLMIRFTPGAALRVKASRDKDHFVFTDAAGARYWWLGDVRDLKAQREATEFAYQAHRVGYDEHEWLRMAESKKK